jgi:hypothetical protein
MDSSTSSVPHNIVSGTYEQLIAFLVLHIWASHFGLPLLLAIIIFSKKIQRHPTFINLCLALIVMGVSSSLLLYAGKITGPEPPKHLCLLQSSLLFGVPALTSLSAFMLVLQMFFVIRASYYGKEMLDRDHVLRSWMMLILPWFFFIASVLATALVGSANPAKISRNRRFFYCTVESPLLSITILAFGALCLLMTFVTELWTVTLLYKRWVAVRQRGSTLRWNIELNLPVRILSFGLFVIVACSLSILGIRYQGSPVPDLVTATTGSFMLAIFGTQRDILHALCFWRKSPPPLVVNKLAVADIADDGSSEMSGKGKGF